MIIVARASGSDRISFVFEGENRDALERTAVANGCVEWVEAAEKPEKGSRLVNGVVVAPAAPDPAVARAAMIVTRRQLLIALASPPWSFISAEEAIAAATIGAMPAAVEAAIADLPAAEAMAARVTWATMTQVERLDPLVDLLAATQGASPEAIDAFFMAAASI